MTPRTNKPAIVLLLIVVSGAALCAAVQQTGRRGDGTLHVQVLTEGHRVIETQVLVRVRNIEDTDERWETTHLGSEATISNLARGSYTVEVSAVGFQTSTVRVEVRASVQLTQVILRPDIKKPTSAPNDIRSISGKARKECAKGIHALQAGKLKEAEKLFRKALKMAPDHAHVNYLLAITLVQEKRLPEGISFLERSIALDPSHAQALTALGGLRLEAKDYPAATNLLERAVAANDRQWRPHLLLANACLAQEQYEQARQHAELAVNLSDHSAPYATLVLAQALSGLGRNAEALAAFKDFLVQAPSNPDAATVRTIVDSLEHTEAGAVRKVQPTILASTDVAVLTTSFVSSVAPTWGPADVDSVTPPVAAGVQCPSQQVLAGVTQNVTDLVDDLDRFTAVRTQVHQQLDLLGHSVERQSRKTRYLAAITRHPGGLELHEYSQDLSGLGAFSDGIGTHGMLGLALIFHPTLQDSYEMQCEGLGAWGGEPAWLVHFRQRPDRPLRLQSFRVAGHEYSLAIKGRAWISANHFRILHIEADLVAPISDIELRSEHQIAEYGAVESKKKKTTLWLPKDTQTYVELRGRRYLFSDHFDDFVLFSVETQHAKSGEVNSQP